MSTNEITTKVRDLKELQALIEEAQAEAEAIKDEIKAYMAATGKEEMTVDVFKVRYTTVTSSRFDSAAFKKTHGDLYAQYTKQTETRRFSVAWGQAHEKVYTRTPGKPYTAKKRHKKALHEIAGKQKREAHTA